MARKFPAPAANPYDTLIQSTDAAQIPEEKTEFYRFNAKLPIECKDFLQEMAWRNRTTITEYIARLIRADMEAHPEWKETVDISNLPKK